jgi:hypothetical protein
VHGHGIRCVLDVAAREGREHMEEPDGQHLCAAAWVVATNCLPSSPNRPGHECAYLCPIASR